MRRLVAAYGLRDHLQVLGAARVQPLAALVGWVSVDEDDTPSVLGRYIAYALERAGLDLSVLNDQDGWNSTPFMHQMGVLAGAMERHETPCMLVFDEVDRLPRRTLALLGFLARRGPRNLHIVFAFRTNPGLDLATHVLDGSGIVVDAEEFRFSRSEIARFFDGDLSRRELDAVLQRTAGWPFALTVDRLSRATSGGPGRMVAEQVTANFLAVRLLQDLSAEQRACLLDLAVFDWIDEELVDEVLGSCHARRVVAAMSSLDGFLLPLDRGGRVQRLHPMVRRYCSDLPSAEDPARERSLRVRIARALAARDHLVEAWRHASSAQDELLVGELIERVGVCRLWLRDGMMQLISAERFLTPGIVNRYPRLALLRCIVLRLGLKLDDAVAECREHGLAAQASFASDVRYGNVYVNIYMGMGAMAQGRVEEAIGLYRRARELTKKFFSTDACLAVINDVLMIEIDLERNRTKAIEQRTLSGLTELRGAWVDLYSAAMSVSAELTQIRHGGEATVELLTTAYERVRNAGFESTFVDHVSALRVMSLVECGRVDEAARVRRDDALPTAVPELLDFGGRSWRSLEAIGCARLRLLVAQGDFRAAEEMAVRLLDASLSHGLVRTAIRCLALSMEAAERAGQNDRATARLVDYLRLMAGTDYVRPLVRCLEVSRVVVRRLLGMQVEPGVREVSPRELEVLGELREGKRNKDIATRLGISDAGVRYHLKEHLPQVGCQRAKGSRPGGADSQAGWTPIAIVGRDAAAARHLSHGAVAAPKSLFHSTLYRNPGPSDRSSRIRRDDATYRSIGLFLSCVRGTARAILSFESAITRGRGDRRIRMETVFRI